MLPAPLPGCRAFFVAVLLLTPALAAAQPDDSEPSYEFLRRQAVLLADYGKMSEALESLEAACRTPEGSQEPLCFEELGALAERGGQIGLAVESWERLRALGGPSRGRAATELARLQGIYGEVRLRTEGGRALPSLPIELDYEGLQIDPVVKAYLARRLEEIGLVGFGEPVQWLPAGRYVGQGIEFTVQAGESLEVSLGPEHLPWRPQAFGLADGPDPAALRGPWELALGLGFHASGSPAAELGLSPVGGSVSAHLSRQIGPLRVGGGLELGLDPTRSVEGIDSLGGPSSPTLAEVEVGVLLALGSHVYLLPRIGVLGGLVGRPVLTCLAEVDASVWAGKCRAAAWGVGLRAGADLTVVPRAAAGRLVLRFRFHGDALPTWIQAAPDGLLQGSLGGTLVRVEPWRYTQLRGGVTCAVGLRF